MLSGDLRTMPLSDLLQWVDTRRRACLVHVQLHGGEQTWFQVEGRAVVATARPLARGMLSADGEPGRPGPKQVALARENLLDLFLGTDGKFEVRDRGVAPGPAVRVQIAVQFLVMEGLRLLDEWPGISARYPTDEARLAATDKPPSDLDPIADAIRELALSAPALGEARLVLGLSRASLLRRVEVLAAKGLVEIEGTPHGPDIERSVLDQAQSLLRERQYLEAAHVFRSLLATKPGDPRIRSLLSEAEAQHCAALYKEFPPTHVIAKVSGADLEPLRGGELAVLECLPRSRSVAVLVLVSPLRELETLLALGRLRRRGVIAVESAD